MWPKLWWTPRQLHDGSCPVCWHIGAALSKKAWASLPLECCNLKVAQLGWDLPKLPTMPTALGSAPTPGGAALYTGHRQKCSGQGSVQQGRMGVVPDAAA